MSFIFFILKALLVILLIVGFVWAVIWGSLMLYGLAIQTIISAWSFVLDQRRQYKRFLEELKLRK